MRRQLAVLILLVGCASAQAWGPEGHRIVAQIAAGHLNPTAQRKVADLLAGELEPTLAGVANWADEVRTPETEPLHFINLPPGRCSYLPRRDCPRGRSVVGGIKAAVGVLKNARSTRAQKTIALKNLAHFVGDIHQPLHADLADDHGGNRFRIRWQNHGDNLHRLWDSGLIAAIEPDWRRYARRLSPREPDASTLTPGEWALASCAIARSPDFYPDDRRPDAAYLRQWRDTLDQQLDLAGLHLAALLNTVFKP